GQYPLMRTWRGFRRASWDDALDLFTSKVRDIQARHGKASSAVLSTGQLLSEEFYTLGKLVQLGFGTRNYDGNTTLCMASAVSGYKRSYGIEAPPWYYKDLEKADLILLIGANIADTHPILCQRLERNPNATVI